jgi:hypothetical protein
VLVDSKNVKNRFFKIANYLFKSFIVCAVSEIRKQKYFAVIVTNITIKSTGDFVVLTTDFFGRVKILRRTSVLLELTVQ